LLGAVAAGAAAAVLLDVLAVEEGQQEELERGGRLLRALARLVEQVVGHVGVEARQQRRLAARRPQHRRRRGRRQVRRGRVVEEEREAGHSAGARRRQRGHALHDAQLVDLLAYLVLL
jgi:hypothetical protein